MANVSDQIGASANRQDHVFRTSFHCDLLRIGPSRCPKEIDNRLPDLNAPGCAGDEIDVSGAMLKYASFQYFPFRLLPPPAQFPPSPALDHSLHPKPCSP